MTTSLHDLLTTARTLLAELPIDGAGAAQAVATLAPTARALRMLAADGFEAVSDDRRSIAIREVANQCDRAAPGWPSPSSLPSVSSARLPAVVSVAADAAAQLSRNLGRSARWCAAIEFTSLARNAATTARRVPAYRHIRPLTALGTLAGQIEQFAAAEPPNPPRLAGLDRPITSPHLPAGPLGPHLAGAAAARLVTEIYATRGPGLRAVEARATAIACQAAASTLQNLAVALHKPRRTQLLSAVIHDWASVELALRPLIDRFRPTAPSPLIAHAVLLHRCLSDSTPARHTDINDLADYATHARMIGNQLPAIAAALRGGLVYAAYAGGYTARARHLPPNTERLVAAGHNRTVIITPSDLKPATTALRRVEASSARLAARLAQSAGLVGQQPQPYLAAALAAQTDNAQRPVI